MTFFILHVVKIGGPGPGFSEVHNKSAYLLNPGQGIHSPICYRYTTRAIHI